MSMPSIPYSPNRPDRHDVFIDLLESIALEEIALSHILNAEGEKSQLIVKQFHKLCPCTFVNNMDKLCASNISVLDEIIMNQWLLIKKLDKVSNLADKCF